MNRILKFSISAFLCSLGMICTIAHASLRIEHWTAPSGARVYFVQSRSLPMLDIELNFAAGSALDPQGKSGLAELTCSLMTAGAGEWDEHAIADRLADVGAELGDVSDMDRAGFTLRTLSNPQEREPALALLRAIVSQPHFPTVALQRELARNIARLREMQTQPEAILTRRFNALVFGDHPYGRMPTEESLQAITQEDMHTFYRQYFSAARAVVTIVGDATRAEAEHMAQQLTAALPAGVPVAALPGPSLPAAVEERIAHPATQAHIAIGQPGLSRQDPDYFPLLVGNYVLGGGGFSSRLMAEVRDKRGLTYGVQSYFIPMQVSGAFQISLQTEASQADKALGVVRDTVQAFLQSGPTQAELDAAKANIVNGFALRIDSNKKVLEYVAMIGFYALPLDYLERYPRQVQQVTLEQIRDAFTRRIRPQSMITVVVGGHSGAKP